MCMRVQAIGLRYKRMEGQGSVYMCLCTVTSCACVPLHYVPVYRYIMCLYTVTSCAQHPLGAGPHPKVEAVRGVQLHGAICQQKRSLGVVVGEALHSDHCAGAASEEGSGTVSNRALEGGRGSGDGADGRGIGREEGKGGRKRRPDLHRPDAARTSSRVGLSQSSAREACKCPRPRYSCRRAIHAGGWWHWASQNPESALPVAASHRTTVTVGVSDCHPVSHFKHDVGEGGGEGELCRQVLNEWAAIRKGGPASNGGSTCRSTSFFNRVRRFLSVSQRGTARPAVRLKMRTSLVWIISRPDMVAGGREAMTQSVGGGGGLAWLQLLGFPPLPILRLPGMAGS